MTFCILIGAALLAALIALWWFLDDLDLPAVTTVAAPLAGAGILYLYGTEIAWALGALLVLIGALGIYFYIRRRNTLGRVSRASPSPAPRLFRNRSARHSALSAPTSPSPYP